MPLFSIPLSGLSSNSDALSVISNNLANLNTIGYKDQTVTFRDLFYQSLGNTGGGDPIQIGAGAAIGSISSNFTDGNLQSTGVSTDVAIQGEGFFITDNNGTTQYTRGGHFKIADDGYLTTQDGQYVMGYPAAAGSIASNKTLSHIQLNRGQTSPPSATSRVQMTLNLNWYVSG
jgi:flagellar hook protein FlgE